jgi:hypothetical protein
MPLTIKSLKEPTIPIKNQAIRKQTTALSRPIGSIVEKNIKKPTATLRKIGRTQKPLKIKPR